MEKDVVELLCKKYGKSECTIRVMLEKAEEIGYNKESYDILLKEFYDKN